MLNLDAESCAIIGMEVPVSTDLAMSDAYEGASRFDSEVAMWEPDSLSADREITPVKSISDRRSRNITNNDAYVINGVSIQQDSIVGDLYMLNAKPNFQVLGLDETWAEEFQDEVESKFTLWAESPECWVDASGVNTFTQLIRLGVMSWGTTGEILATAEWLRDKDRPLAPFRTSIQMIDTDRLMNPFGYPDTPTLTGGVERNKNGLPIAYHIRNAHPTDYNNPDSFITKRVPARKPWGRRMVIHILEQSRPGQARAISQMVAALKEMKMTKNFRDTVLQSAVLNASYAATIESELPAEAAYAAIGAGDGNGVSQWATQYLAAVGQYTSGAKHIKMNGVKVPHLFPGTTLNLRNAATPGGVGQNFEQSLLRYIAAALGISYEQLSKDYSQTNYSSARAAANETEKRMKGKKRFISDKLASMIYRLWLEEALNSGAIKLPAGAPNFYEGQNADAYAACTWTGAGRGQIDELKETQAAVLRLKYNLSSAEDEIARLGKDWRVVYKQQSREKKMRDELGIAPVESNAINAASGTPSDGEGGVTNAD